MRHLIMWSIALIFCSAPAYSNPESVQIFCQKYESSTFCVDQEKACVACHSGPPSLNSYGAAISAEVGGDLANQLFAALDKLEDLDSDGDGVSNKSEILANSHPGNADIKPAAEVNVIYDPLVALKRIKAIYCGESVSYAEVQALESSADAKASLHATLDTCLDSDYWIREGLQRIADKRIQPLSTIGFGGQVVIGDYRFDYRLFAYVMSGDRDARDLLAAQYHVDENYNRVEGVLDREEQFQVGERIVIAGGQPLDPARRAGMITTQWFISNNTMFAPLPRNTASMAYRAYLGLDLAKGEGIIPVPGEPRDVDNKNIDQPACAVCHSTLDPLAYSFASYQGIEIGVGLLFNNIGTYDEGRTPWGGDGVVLGQPAQDLMEWAAIARESDAFKKNIVNMIWEATLGRAPYPHEVTEFQGLWQNLPAQNYSVNQMIHSFIETNAFGGVIQ